MHRLQRHLLTIVKNWLRAITMVEIINVNFEKEARKVTHFFQLFIYHCNSAAECSLGTYSVCHFVTATVEK
jgi:hypothetical protein